MGEVVRCWLDLVVADAELASCLVGVDRARLSARLTELLDASLGESPGAGRAGADQRDRREAGWLDAPDLTGLWRGLGLTEGQHRRVIDYLGGVLWALNVPPQQRDPAVAVPDEDGEVTR